MSDQPLYYNPKIPRTINPTKILPSLLQRQEQKKKQTQNNIKINSSSFLDLSSMAKDKKIKKQQTKNYRTKMCPKGRECRNRFTCRFAHNQQQLRKPFMKRKNPCILYQRGECSLGSACRDYHGNMDLTKNYKMGTCEKGNVCIFIHDDYKVEQQGVQRENQINQQINNVQGKLNKQEQLNFDINQTEVLHKEQDQKWEEEKKKKKEETEHKKEQRQQSQYEQFEQGAIILSFQ